MTFTDRYATSLHREGRVPSACRFWTDRTTTTAPGPPRTSGERPHGRGAVNPALKGTGRKDSQVRGLLVTMAVYGSGDFRLRHCHGTYNCACTTFLKT